MEGIKFVSKDELDEAKKRKKEAEAARAAKEDAERKARRAERKAVSMPRASTQIPIGSRTPKPIFLNFIVSNYSAV